MSSSHLHFSPCPTTQPICGHCLPRFSHGQPKQPSGSQTRAVMRRLSATVDTWREAQKEEDCRQNILFPPQHLLVRECALWPRPCQATCSGWLVGISKSAVAKSFALYRLRPSSRASLTPKTKTVGVRAGCNPRGKIAFLDFRDQRKIGYPSSTLLLRHKTWCSLLTAAGYLGREHAPTLRTIRSPRCSSSSYAFAPAT